MRAGELTERIIIERPEHVVSGSGAKTLRWVASEPWYAQKVSGRGFRREEVGEHFADHTATFLVRSSVEVGENWRLRHIGGYLYTVTAIEPSRRLGMLTLTCERVNE